MYLFITGCISSLIVTSIIFILFKLKYLNDIVNSIDIRVENINNYLIEKENKKKLLGFKTKGENDNEIT